MKDKIIKKVVQHMAHLSQDDIELLENVLAIALNDCDIQPKKNEVVEWSVDDNYKFLGMFLTAKKVQGCSERTLKYYKQTIKIFLDKTPTLISQMTPGHIRYYLANRDVVDHVSKCTQNNERRCLSSFFSWLHSEEYITKNPMNRITNIKQKKTKKDAFSDMEIETLRCGLETDMDKSIFELLLSTGCRVSELCGIRLSDIENDKILVHGKGGKDRTVYMNARALLSIKNYVKRRTDANPYLFPKRKAINSISGGNVKEKDWFSLPEYVSESDHIATGTVEGKIRNLGRKYGIKAHPHKFRRTCATMALRRGMPLLAVSKMLGHENIGTTQIYLDIDESEVYEAHKKYVT